jgi:hypothetical protein
MTPRRQHHAELSTLTCCGIPTTTAMLANHCSHQPCTSPTALHRWHRHITMVVQLVEVFRTCLRAHIFQCRFFPPIYAESVLCFFEVVYDLNPYEESDLMHRRKAGSIPTFCLPLKSFIVSLHPSVAPFPLSPTLSRPFLHALCLRHSLARTRTHPYSSTRAVQTNMFLCTNTPGSRICCPGRRGLPATAAAAAAVF